MNRDSIGNFMRKEGQSSEDCIKISVTVHHFSIDGYFSIHRTIDTSECENDALVAPRCLDKQSESTRFEL